MARRFYDQAVVDLDSAQENIRPRRYHNAVLFSEQAAEKGLKAAHWHLLAEEPVWTHQMDRIAARVAEDVGGVPEEVLTAISQLMSSLERSRYPSGNVDEPIPAQLIDETDAITAVGQAERILTWAGSLLQLPTGRPKRKKN